MPVTTYWSRSWSVIRAILASQLVACAPTEPASSGHTAADADAELPPGRERLFLNRQSPLDLAPSREVWLTASAYIQTSASSMVPVPAAVTFQSSDPEVATVIAGDSGAARVTARRVGTATITVRSTRDPSNVMTRPVTVHEAPVGNEEGLVFTATATLRPTFSGPAFSDAPLGPMELDVRATISNPTSGPRDIWLSGCTAWIRLYRTADRSGAPVADVPRGVECVADAIHVWLAPGESRTSTAEGYRLDIARDTLSPGRYYVAAAVDRLRTCLRCQRGRWTS